jgi:WD40 repeat protein
VKVWDATTGKAAAVLPGGGPDVNIFSIAFSPDNRWLVAGSISDYRWRRVGSWEPGPRIAKDQAEVLRSPLAFSRDGRLLAIVRTSHTVQLVDPTSGREFATLTDPNRHSFTWLSFSPDGSQLAACTHEHVIQLWDLRLLREELADLRLDWDLPPYPPAKTENPIALRVEVTSTANAGPR